MGTTTKKIVLSVISIAVVVSSALVISCNSGEISKQLNNDGCEETVRSFFDWYYYDHKKIDTIDLVTIDSRDSIYRVNFQNADQYLTELKNAHLFSEKFMQDMRTFFRMADSSLIIARQIDDPAIGFEADLLLHSQEAEYILENRGKIEFTQHGSDSTCSVTAKFGDDVLLFTIDRSGKLINSIERK